jgi:transcriptional regulator with XRE-family HTH domain
MASTANSTDFFYLANNLRLHRVSQRKTQRELGHQANLSPVYVCRLEHGLWPSRADHVERLAAALDVDAATLLRRPLQIGAHRRIRSREAVR